MIYVKVSAKGLCL